MTVKFCCCVASYLLLWYNKFTSGSEMFIVAVK